MKKHFYFPLLSCFLFLSLPLSTYAFDDEDEYAIFNDSDVKSSTSKLSEEARDRIFTEEVTRGLNKPYKGSFSKKTTKMRKLFEREIVIERPSQVGKDMPNPLIYLNLKGGLISLGDLIEIISHTIKFEPLFVDETIKSRKVKIGFKKLKLSEIILVAERSAGVIINQYPESKIIQVMGDN